MFSRMVGSVTASGIAAPSLAGAGHPVERSTICEQAFGVIPEVAPAVWRRLTGYPQAIHKGE